MKPKAGLNFCDQGQHSFGMLVVGRSWEVGSEYRYGFNGKESESEIIHDAYNYGNRIYNSNLGRWFSPDLLEKLYTSHSTYSFAGNNPILFIDLDGRGIYSFWTKKIVAQKRYILDLESTLDNYECLYGTISNKNIFYENGGSKEQWRDVKEIKKEHKIALSDLNHFQVQEQISNNIITEWQNNSPNMFKELSALENQYGEVVDIYIKNENIFDATGNTIPDGAVGGYNESPKFDVNDKGEIRPRGVYGINTITITIETDKFDRQLFELIKGHNIYNHEAGHFWYMVKHTSEYKEYTDQIIKEGREYNGGHNPDDESGKKAEEFGKLKDL